jgi:hypothetical protein
MLNNPLGNNNPPAPGGQTPPGAQDPPGQTPTQTPPGGQTPPPTTPPNQNQRTSLDTLPDDVQEYIRTLRDEGKTLRQAAAAEAAKKKEEADALLKEQGQFKQLAETHEARVKELEPVADQYKKLAETVNDQIKAEIKDWPAELKTFDPGPSAPVETRLEWVHKSRPLLQKLQGTAAGGAPGNSSNPRPAPQAGDVNGEVNELRRRYSESGRYGF